MKQGGKSSEPGNTARVIAGPHCGSEGKVIDFFQEINEDNAPVPDGLKGLILDIEGRKIAFWRDEVQLRR